MTARKIYKTFEQDKHLYKDCKHYSQKYRAYIKTLEPKKTPHGPLILANEKGIPLHSKEIEQWINVTLKASRPSQQS